MNTHHIHDIAHARERQPRVCQCGAITRDWLTIGRDMYECAECREKRDRQDEKLVEAMLGNVGAVPNERGPESDFYDGMRGCRLKGIE